jgi:hypothetical protein
MTKNPILDELHAIREQLLADSGGTLDALVDRLQTEERDSDRPQYEARRTRQCPGAAKSDEIAADNQSSRPRGR